MRLLRVLLFVLLAATALHGQNYTQGYTQIVVFGDSLSDTGNFAHITQSNFAVRYPSPAFNYADGHFTDATNTAPATRLYNGVWLEQLAATLTPVPAVLDSLDGGTNYAYGGATNAPGTTTSNLAGSVSITVPNVGAQIAAYLATKPVINGKTLFVVWGGANDLLQATSSAAITTAVQQAGANIQTLIAAGATQFMVPNLPPLGAIPNLNNNAANAATATAAAMAYNSGLAATLVQISAANPKVNLYPLDTYSLFNAILPSPAVTGFANVTSSAQGVTTINPDTYLFWDGLHPTTYGHYLLSRYARNQLTQVSSVPTTLTLSASVVNPAQVVTLTAKAVSPIAGVAATGLFTFYAGSVPFATVVLDGSGTASTTLVAGAASQTPYTLTAHYSGDNTFYGNGNNPALQLLTVANPGYTFSASPSTVTTLHMVTGAAGSTTLTLAPAGNLTGTYTPACGTLPAYVTCSFSPGTLVAGNNNAVSTTLTFSTAMTAANTVPARPGSLPGLPIFTAFTLLGGLGMAARRRKGLRLLGATAFLALAGMTTLTGCTGNGPGATSSGPTIHYTPAGTYTVPVTLTPAVSGSNNTLNITLIVQ